MADCDEEEGRIPLPPQLNRLPKEKLSQVGKALEELAATGLKDLPDVAFLAMAVKPYASRPPLPAEDKLSTYQAMSLWTWTPNCRAKAQQPQAALAPSATSVSADEPPPRLRAIAKDITARVERLKARLKDRAESLSWLRRRRRFQPRAPEVVVDEWLQAMLAADAQLREMATMGAVKVLGDGPGVLFEYSPAARPSARLPALSPRPDWQKRGHFARFEPRKLPGQPLTVQPAVLTVHLGAEGCETAASLWQSLLEQHWVSANGAPIGCPSAVFAESRSGRHVPRAILAGFGEAASRGLLSPASVLVGQKEASLSPGAAWTAGKEGNFSELCWRPCACKWNTWTTSMAFCCPTMREKMRRPAVWPPKSWSR
ncbi:unnamed protein product [Effrenium voratum]|nr:unnamed protein product [Effrenium voratum]